MLTNIEMINRPRKIDASGRPAKKSDNCDRCGELAEKPGLLCTNCKDHYRAEYGMIKKWSQSK